MAHKLRKICISLSPWLMRQKGGDTLTLNCLGPGGGHQVGRPRISILLLYHISYTGER